MRFTNVKKKRLLPKDEIKKLEEPNVNGEENKKNYIK